MTIAIAMIVVWYLIGCWSFQRWWREDLDLDTGAAVLMLVAGLLGPVSYFIGWCIHGKRSPSAPKVLLRRHHHDR